MRKMFILLLSLLMSLYGYCAYKTIDGVTWNYSVINGIVKINGISGSLPSSVKIPSSIDGYAVTSIGNNVFRGYSSLSSLTIPDSVTNIWDYAFEGCSLLTSIMIPDNVINIGYGAFDGCSNITSVTVSQCVCNGRNKLSDIFVSSAITNIVISDSVTTIGHMAFYGCSSLTNITIPNSVTNIESIAFKGCSSLTSITIPDSITNIGYGAFDGCSNITSVIVSQCVCNGRNSLSDIFVSSAITNIVISGSVTNIGRDAFSDCTSLTSITIPDSVINIGDSAFEDCSSLTSITIPDSVINIGDSAFEDCSSLTSITISDSVTTIGHMAFYGCSSLTSITIPNSVTNIESYAFSYCTSLTNIMIPDNVINIEHGAFDGCSNITSVTVSQCVCNGRNKLSDIFVSSAITNIVISDSVTNIGYSAFSGCASLTSITIPDSVTNIGSSAFSGCTSLTSITIPDSVTSIKRGTFYECSSLANIGIPNTVVDMGNFVFYSCNSLTNVLIPDGVMNIGECTFCNCSSLTNMEIPNSVTNIGGFAFYNCSSLTNMVIPGSVNNIGSSAFYNCDSLMAVCIPIDCIVAEDAFPSSIEIVRYNPIITISLDANGGELEYDTLERKFHTVYGSIPIPSRMGFVFKGWSLNGEDILSETVVEATADHTLVAQWIPNQYSIVFDANGGDGGKSEMLDCGTELTAPDVMRVGYTFKKWNPEVPAIVPPSNATYTAQWEINKYKVTFNANGGEGGTSTLQDYGSAIIVPKVTRVGYTFKGWIPLVALSVPTSDVSYTAQWEINKYKVTFNANGGEGGTSEELKHGSLLTIPSVTRDGYRFLGWFTEPEGGDEIAEDLIASCDITMYAHWKKIWNVSFDANGFEQDTLRSKEVDDMTVLGDLPVLTYWGYTFKGWRTNKEGGDTITSETIVTSNMVLYAHWERHVVPNPIVTSSSGIVFYDKTSKVSISCPMEGATIYYSKEGKTPKLSESYRYKGEFVITETTTIKAVAVFEDVKSEYVTVTIEKKVLTIKEALDSNIPYIKTGGSANWVPIFDKIAKDTMHCAKSGDIEDDEESWIEVSVLGAGTLSFWCKTSCEHDDDGTFTWDRLMIYTNGVELTEWRMDGESDWTKRVLSFAGGENTIRWCYFKDESESYGEDCAWVDCLTWTATTIPELPQTATPEQIAAAFEGFADTRFVANITT